MSTSILVGLIAAPLLAASIFGAMVMAARNFESGYMETLCRMESVRVHALDDIENDRPMAANFGGDECVWSPTPMAELPWPTPNFEEFAPTPTAAP